MRGTAVDTGEENRLTAGKSLVTTGRVTSGGDEILREATPASIPSSS